MKFSIKDFFSKCNLIRSFLRILSYLLKKNLMENLIFCAVTPFYSPPPATTFLVTFGYFFWLLTNWICSIV